MILGQIKEVYNLLSLNYVEDDDASFRFQYTAEFLHWWVTIAISVRFTLEREEIGHYDHLVITKNGMLVCVFPRTRNSWALLLVCPLKSAFAKSGCSKIICLSDH